jgi:hypothetical protein
VAYVGNQPARGQWRKLSDISSAFDGVITTFTTSVPPGTSQYFVTAGSASQLLISLGGVIQEPDVDYTVSTNSVTFTTPPTSGLSFFGVLCGDALNAGVPSDGSVTTSKLAGGLSVGLTGGSVSTPSLFFTGDDNTGVFSAGADQLNIATNGVERVEFGTGEVVFNDGGANYDFRIEGDTNANLFFVDASAEAVGIGTTSPRRTLEVSGADGLLCINATDTSTGTSQLLFGDNDDDNIGRIYYDHGTDNMAFWTNTSEKARIDTSGRLLVGTPSARTIFDSTASLIQVETTSNANRGISLTHNINSAAGTYLQFAKTRGSGNAIVSANDVLGTIIFGGADGTNVIKGAQVLAEVDGTPGANDMPSRLVFATTADGASAPTERMRITNIGTVNTFSTTSGFLGVRNAGSASGDSALIVFKSATSTTNGTACMVVRQDGDLENTNNSYGALSDVKLKENIVDANSQWDDLKALQVRNYNFKKETDYGTHRQIGLIAQEVELVSPGLVSESPDRDEEGNDLGTATKSVNYSVLYMKAVKALQEAMERIEQLETSNADLLARVTALETS